MRHEPKELVLCNGKLRILSQFGGAKAQHDMLSGYSGINKLIGNPTLGSIALNPELSIDEQENTEAPN